MGTLLGDGYIIRQGQSNGKNRVYAFIKNTHTKKRPNGSISCIVYVNGFFCVETPLVIAFPMKRPGTRGSPTSSCSAAADARTIGL